LFVEDGELLAGADEPVVDVAERPFDEGSAHRTNSTPRGGDRPTGRIDSSKTSA
jgi:hypothetical protein